jgi:ADP-ribosylglycohydrolase
MRVAPVGLALSLDDPFGLACEIAALTHGHPTGFLAAGAFALVIRDLVLGGEIETAVREALEELGRQVGHEECTNAIERAVSAAAEGSPTPEKLESLGGGWVAEEALAISIYCALSSPDLPRGLRLAVNHSGDSDSTGSMTGNLLGARFGDSSLPTRWLEALELCSEIERIADELHEVFRRESGREGRSVE